MTIYETYKDDLHYSRRRNVTLLPCQPIPYSGTSAYGFVGSYEEQMPIPESLRLTMGWQLHLFAPFQEASEYIDDTVIYAGMPNSGFGHFLLDAMARLWYAKDHPEMPIVWDGTALPAFAAPILDLVGIRNQHLFLDRPMRFREVVFPFPGVAIGDYFLKGHAEFLGAYQGGLPIPGKKLYLSRKNIKSGVVIDEEAVEDLVRNHGFQVFYPEQHTITEQLEEISTSSIVLGVEGSAFHSVVLLKTPFYTRFYALARHRLGGGVFEHVRLRKGIQYTTLNLLRKGEHLSAESEVDVDIDLLSRMLVETRGLDEHGPVNKYAVSVEAPQNSYFDAIPKFKLGLTEEELAAYKVLQLHLKRGELEAVSRIAPAFQAVRIAIQRNEAVNLATRAGRLNSLSNICKAESYLEIGVYAGATFNQVKVRRKVAVDPKFAFDFRAYQSNDIQFFEVESDEFFAKHAQPGLKFDLIYLDGLHEFEQTFRDLLNCLSFVHERSLILIDDTLPKHYAAAQKHKSDNLLIRKVFDVYDNSWMGDVYRIVPAIHDFLPMYSYFTFPGLGQTVLFRKPRDVSSRGGGRRFSGLEEISRLSYVDFLKLRDEGLYNILPTNEAIIESLQSWFKEQ
jgi:hypothetical protein